MPIPIVPSSNVQGKRVVGRFLMDLTVTNPEPVLDNPLYWVLLNIKEGYSYNIPNITANSDFYNPNQAVIDCGTTSAYLATEGAPLGS